MHTKLSRRIRRLIIVDRSSSNLRLGRSEHISQALNLALLSDYIWAQERFPLRSIYSYGFRPLVWYWSHPPGLSDLPALR